MPSNNFPTRFPRLHSRAVPILATGLSTVSVDSGKTMESHLREHFVMLISVQICTIYKWFLYWRR